MSLSIYMDVHVPAPISAGLRRRGLDVLTSQEGKTAELSDEELLVRATELGRLLFTQDDDLLQIAAGWQAQQKPFNGVIYAHQLSAGIGRLVQELELVLVCCDAEEVANQVVHLPLN